MSYCHLGRLQLCEAGEKIMACTEGYQEVVKCISMTNCENQQFVRKFTASSRIPKTVIHSVQVDLTMLLQSGYFGF